MPEYNLPNYHMGNLILVLSAIAWASAQVLKVVVVLITRRRLDWRYIWASGGMPSSHSAFVCACAAATGNLYGWSSALFAIAAVLGNVSELPAVKNAFAGIRVGVAVLMINSVIKLAKAAIVDWKAVLIFLAVFGGAVFTPVSPMIYIVAAGVAGILLKTWEVKAK